MRRADWVPRLNAELEAATEQTFELGRFDCATFTARCIDAVVEGSAREAEIRAACHDARSALRFLEAEGGLEAATTKRLGEPVSWWHMRRGDICLVETEDGPALAVCMGAVVAAPGKLGIITRPQSAALKAWRVD